MAAPAQGDLLYRNASAWVRLPAGTSGHVLTTGGTGANPSWAAASGAGAFVKIDEQTPTGTGTVTFSSLGSYTHLRIVYAARGTQAATSTTMAVQFNADTGANYDRLSIFNSTASAVAASESLAQTSGQVGSIVAANGTANAAGSGVIEIVDYRGTAFHKTVYATNNLPRTTASAQFFNQTFAVRWRDASAITQLSLILSSGNYDTGSKFSLYGIT